MSQKNILLTFKGFCMNFSLELKKIILSHPVTSKQPHKIVQILMRHPVYNETDVCIPNSKSIVLNKGQLLYYPVLINN